MYAMKHFPSFVFLRKAKAGGMGGVPLVELAGWLAVCLAVSFVEGTTDGLSVVASYVIDVYRKIMCKYETVCGVCTCVNVGT